MFTSLPFHVKTFKSLGDLKGNPYFKKAGKLQSIRRKVFYLLRRANSSFFQKSPYQLSPVFKVTRQIHISFVKGFFSSSSHVLRATATSPKDVEFTTWRYNVFVPPDLSISPSLIEMMGVVYNFLKSQTLSEFSPHILSSYLLKGCHFLFTFQLWEMILPTGKLNWNQREYIFIVKIDIKGPGTD